MHPYPNLHINMVATLLAIGAIFSLVGALSYRFPPPPWVRTVFGLPQTQQEIIWRVIAPGIACLAAGMVWGLLVLGGMVSPTIPN